jgi:hypothetical protein
MLTLSIRMLVVLIGIGCGALKAAAETVGGYVMISIIAPVSVMSLTGAISPTIGTSTGWVTLMIPRGSNSTSTFTVLSNVQGARAKPVKSESNDSAVLPDDQAAKPEALSVDFSDGTLNSDLATSMSLAVRDSAGYAATVAFN